MDTKSSQLQIRVTPAQKVVLKDLASNAGLSVSAYVLGVLLPSRQLEFNRCALALGGATDLPRALSELQGLLSELPRAEFLGAVEAVTFDDASPLIQNLVAAAVEQEAQTKGVAPPAWVSRVQPLERPHFTWTLRSLRPHLMRVTPLVFKRRNVFVAALDDPRQ